MKSILSGLILQYKEQNVMKNFIFAAIFVFSVAGQAAVVKLQCKTAESENDTLLKNVSLLMNPINTDDAAPVSLKSQTVTILSESEGSEVSDKVFFKAAKNTNNLTGSISLGEDFGSADITLIHDYDRDEIVAIFQITTDGPITVNVYRCK